MLRNILSEAQNVGDQRFNRRKMLKLLLELGESFEWDDSEWYRWFSPGLPTAPMLAQILGDQAELDNDLARCCWYYLLWICGVARGDGVNVALWRHGVRIREGILVVNAERLPLFESVQGFRILKDPEDWDERERGYAVVSVGGHDSFHGRKDLVGVIEIHHQGQIYLELECMWRAPLFGSVGADDFVAGAASTQPQAAVPGSPGPLFVSGP